MDGAMLRSQDRGNGRRRRSSMDAVVAAITGDEFFDDFSSNELARYRLLPARVAFTGS
jgi:hypothetical protein